MSTVRRTRTRSRKGSAGVSPAPVGVPPTAQPLHPSASHPSTLSTLRRATEDGRSLATQDGYFVRGQKYPKGVKPEWHLAKESLSQLTAGERVTDMRTTISKMDEFETVWISSRTESSRCGPSKIATLLSIVFPKIYTLTKRRSGLTLFCNPLWPQAKVASAPAPNQTSDSCLPETLSPLRSINRLEKFSHRLSPEPTAGVPCNSAVAVHAASRRWLSFLL